MSKADQIKERTGDGMSTTIPAGVTAVTIRLWRDGEYKETTTAVQPWDEVHVYHMTGNEEAR